jgi:hypothetical protein
MREKRYERSGRGLFDIYPGIGLEELDKTTTNPRMVGIYLTSSLFLTFIIMKTLKI